MLDEAPLQAPLNEALVRELVITAKAGAAGLLLASGVLWVLVRPYTGALVSAMFIVLACTTIARLVGSLWLQRRGLAHRRVYWGLAVLYGVTGSCVAAIVLASLPHLPTVTALTLLVIMVGINATATVTLAGSRLIYALYVTPLWSVWTVESFAHPLPGLELVVQLTLVVYAVVMALTSRNVHNSLRNNIVLRLQLGASLVDLRDAQAQLVEASRQAGRSDVATAVLHNVGNVLHSVNVSAVLANDLITNLRTAKLSQIGAMITDHSGDLAAFFRDDARGQKLPAYFTQLQASLERDKASASSELKSLIRNIEHINVIVSSQQSHVKPGGVIETFDPHDLLDDALKFSAAGDHAIEIVRRFDLVPPVSLDRHKVLQIVMNLLTNARDAVLTRRPGERQIVVSARAPDRSSLEIAVEDNGCGVDPANLDRIFQLGFTTKPSGNGHGLHYSACAARELHGSLTAHSPGVGGGASFLLVLPIS
jgi:signal transduction histidine kinase